jgi:NAD(P)-dependent dehydrogenase (short-subunit alcohol dehydrogenase family)
LLQDKITVVTGATGALGRVVAKHFLEEGAKVIAIYRSVERFNKLRSFVGDLVNDLMGVKGDVTDERSVSEIFTKTVEKYGKVDILINLVGSYAGGNSVADMDVETWDRMMNLNLKSAFLCSKAVLSYMIEQNYGKIVNVSARTAVRKRSRAKNSAYAIAKLGVLALTETIAEEVRRLDINVNCILPSTIDTPANRRDFPKADFSRWVSPGDIAEVILFLASDASKATSGATIPVFGKA